MHDSLIGVWFVCGDRDVGHIRIRSKERLVHFGFCFLMPAGIHLRLPAGRVAVWFGRGSLVSGGAAPMVVKEKWQLTVNNLHPTLR